jgi:hypothetical protein
MVAERVLGHSVAQQKREVFEMTPKGPRPLRAYSSEIAAAWEVVEHLGMTVIPIENNQWFVLATGRDGFKSPAHFIEYLQTGNFVSAGAAVTDSAPLAICIAAIQAVESRRAAAEAGLNADAPAPASSQPPSATTH